MNNLKQSSILIFDNFYQNLYLKIVQLFYINNVGIFPSLLIKVIAKKIILLIRNIVKASIILELMHIDLEFPINSIYHHKYFLAILHYYSSYIWIVLLKSKREVRSLVQTFIHLVENQFETKVIWGPIMDLNSWWKISLDWKEFS